MAEETSDPVFNVKWTNQHESFADGLAQLYTEGSQFDLKITAGGQQLQAHRVVMSIVSPTFKVLLEGLPTQPQAEIEWEMISYDIMKKLLEYIYYGTVNVYKSEMVQFITAVRDLNILTDLYDVEVDKIMNRMNAIKPVEIVWAKRGEQIADGFKQRFEAEEEFDVTLQVEEKELKAHRIALSVCSPYFEAMFSAISSTQPASVEFLNFPHITYESMENLLSFIYRGEVKVDSLIPLLNSGESVEIKGLLGNDYLVSERTNEKNPKSFNIFAGAKGVEADHPLHKSDIRVSKESTRKSMKSGSEYEPESDSDDNIQKRQPSRRIAQLQKEKKDQSPTSMKSGTEFEPQHDSDDQIQKRQRARRIPQPQKDKKCKGRSVEKDEEEFVKMTKKEYQRLMRAIALFESKANVKADSKEDVSDANTESHLMTEHLDINQNIQYGTFDAAASFDGYDHDDDWTQQNDPKEQDIDVVSESNLQYGMSNYCEDLHEDLSSDDKVYVPQPVVKRKGTRIKREDSDFTVEAQFEKSQQGRAILIHNGHRFSLNTSTCKDQRWMCIKRRQFCYVAAYTKELNGKIMANIPPEQNHNHGKLY